MMLCRRMRQRPQTNRRRRHRVALSCDSKLPILVPGGATGVGVAVRRWSAPGSCVASGEARAVAANKGSTMTIPPDLEAQILRYHHVEKWPAGTIARHLHVHHATVARVLAQAGLPRHGVPARHSQIEPYLPFILQTLEKFPTLTASRLFGMVRERGYRGGPDYFRHDRQRPICVCAACRASRRRSTGGTSAISRSVAPAVR